MTVADLQVSAPRRSRSRRRPVESASGNGTPRSAPGSSSPVALAAAADAVAAEVLFGGATREQVDRIAVQAAAVAELPADTAGRLLYTLAVRDSRFLAVEPFAALEAQLRTLLFFAPLTHASLWLSDSGEQTCAAKAGWSPPGRRLREAARRALLGEPSRTRGGDTLRAVRVGRGSAPRAALIVQARRGEIRRGLGFAAEAALAVSPILERRLLLAHTHRSGEQLLDAAERRIARLGFDLHDGPLQRLSLLAGELAALDRQLTVLVSDDSTRRIAERRLADLIEMVSELEHELRELSRSAGNRGTGSLRDELESEVRQFQRRTHVRVRLAIEGDVDRTTRSQRLAVHRVVEEALANVREHSRASKVRISVRRDVGLLHLVIVDNGRGFDVRRALRRASRDGRLGLGAMTERIRLLGGRLEISSRSGGPTVISAALPAWEPQRLSARAGDGDVVAT